MARELHLKAEVLPGGKIEVTDAELPVGQTVEVVVRPTESSGHRLSDDHRQDRQESKRKPDLDEIWPVHSAGSWPKDLSLRREDMY